MIRAFQPSASTKLPPDNAAEWTAGMPASSTRATTNPCRSGTAANAVRRHSFARVSRDKMNIGFNPVGMPPLEADPLP